MVVVKPSQKETEFLQRRDLKVNGRFNSRFGKAFGYVNLSTSIKPSINRFKDKRNDSKCHLIIYELKTEQVLRCLS